MEQGTVKKPSYSNYFIKKKKKKAIKVPYSKFKWLGKSLKKFSFESFLWLSKRLVQIDIY